MGLGSVISTFVMCILFNIILPSGDVGSDINLMYQTLNLDLGDFLELEACKSCYHKTEQDVYYSERELTSNECKTCLYDPYSNCGGYTKLIKNVKELKGETHICSSNETLKVDSHGEITSLKCDRLSNDRCCVTQTKEPKKENPIQKLDRKKDIFSL